MISIIVLILQLQLGSVPPTAPFESEICVSLQEQELFQMINEYRESKKLQPIPFSASLTQVAQTHVKDLHHNYDFSAEAKCNPHSWSKKGSWSSCCYTNDHQKSKCMWDKPKEIAGYNSHGYEIAFYQSDGAMAFTALEGWKKSKSHNPVIVNSGMWEKLTWGGMGIGIFEEYAVVWFGELNDNSQMVECQ